MIEEQVTVTVTKAALTELTDVIGLLEWAQTQDGLSVTVSSRVDGSIVVQAEGVDVATIYASLGDTIIWDGTRFIVEKGQADE
jgi:hypothetical protein